MTEVSVRDSDDGVSPGRTTRARFCSSVPWMMNLNRLLSSDCVAGRQHWKGFLLSEKRASIIFLYFKP